MMQRFGVALGHARRSKRSTSAHHPPLSLTPRSMQEAGRCPFPEVKGEEPKATEDMEEKGNAQPPPFAPRP